jgi:hypothetical protein
VNILPFFKKKAVPLLLPNEEKLKLHSALSESLSNKQPIVLFSDEKKYIKWIRDQTAIHNKNNITRTAAYLDFYRKHPEIHWAFLAHMVSRNAGYSMTDLKNEMIKQFISNEEISNIFHFLESANALIFHDAFPQLLLYEISSVIGKPLFHLLPALNVSLFMKLNWELFIKQKQSELITLALIANEQHYVEQQLIKKSASVLKSLPYILQEKCGLTNVIFPYKKHFHDKKYSLAGLEVDQFIHLKARIIMGKALYQTLFHPSVFNDALAFAEHTPHTGSRSDYWPHFFTSSAEKQKLYSPKLAEVWTDIPHTFHICLDWFKSTESINGFDAFEQKAAYKDMTKNVKLDLLKMTSLNLAAKKIL